MARLACRLAVAAARASWSRTALIVCTIALAAATFLYAAGIPRALDLQDERFLRRESPLSSASPGATLWWAPRGNTQWIPGTGHLYSVAVAGEAGAPLPVGASVMPGPGELVVSPALLRALEDGGSPARVWLPGRVVGTLGREALHDPDELVAYVGWDEAALRATPQVVALTGPPIADRGDAAPKAANGTPVAALSAGVALALLLPIAGLLRVALLADSPTRRRRLGAVGLVGATTGELRRLAAVEGVLYSGAGIALAFVARRLVDSAVPVIRFGGQALFTADLSPAPGLTVAVAVASLLAGMAACACVLVPRSSTASRAHGGSRSAGAAPWMAAAPLGVALLMVVGRMARDQASVGSRAALVVALGLLASGAAASLAWTLRRVAGLAEDRGGAEALIARRGVQADAGVAARGLGSLALAVAVVALAAVAYGSMDAANADPADRVVAVATAPILPDATITAIDRDGMERILTTPGVDAVLPRTIGLVDRPDLVSTKVVYGTCSSFASAFAQDPAAACAGLPDAARYVRPGHPLAAEAGAIPFPLLARVFPPVDVLEAGGAPPRGANEIVIDLADRSDTTVAVVGAAALRASPSSYLTGAAQGEPVDASGLARDLDRATLAANAMVVLAVVTALVAGAERLLSRRRVLAHLSAVGMTSRQARRAAATEFLLGLTAALVVGAVCGLVAGSALVTGLALEVVPAWDRLGRALVVVASVGASGVVVVQWLMTRSFDPTAMRTE